MKVLIQRVIRASVTVDHQIVGKINHGLLALVGIGHGDGMPEVEWMADKMSMLRIFEDENGKMNRSLLDIRGEALIVSQFTFWRIVEKDAGQHSRMLPYPNTLRRFTKRLWLRCDSKGFMLRRGFLLRRCKLN